MLLPDGMRPENSIYYLGSFVLLALQDGPADYIDLFARTREKHDMSAASFTLCLDWLYLAGIMVTDSEGRFCLCSLEA